MLGHFQAAGGGHQGRGGGDVDGVEAVSPGADDVAEGIVRAREVAGLGQQGLGGAGDLLRSLPLDLEGGQEAGENDGIHFTTDHLAEGIAGGVAGERLTLIEGVEMLMHGLFLTARGFLDG